MEIKNNGYAIKLSGEELRALKNYIGNNSSEAIKKLVSEDEYTLLVNMHLEMEGE